MSMEGAFKTTQIGVYNPGRLSDQELERAFVARIKLFGYLLQGITSEPPGSIPQHYLIIGQRGMGKSTLLHRIAVELRKAPYQQAFLPLTFPEEQYNLDRLSKFWLNCLDALADALDREGNAGQLEQLDQDISRWAASKEGKAGELYGHFREWATRTGRRPVLLVDNLGLIFDRLAKEEQHELRAILMEKEAPILVGASAHALTQTVEYGAPFYDAFQIQYLSKLTFEETLDVLRNLAELTHNRPFTDALLAHRPRLRALYQLTGGTPRTLVMLYPLIQGGFSLDIQTDLEGLMDVMTPLYKARFEELSEQMQVILDAVALHWDPIALDDLRQITQLENAQLSPQLKRLYEVGWLERLDAYQKKGQAYEISERFFNIWYLMRRSSRRQKRELLCLTKFLVTLYGEELNQMGERIMQRNATHRDHVSIQLALADGLKNQELARQLRDKSYTELFELSRTDAAVLKDFEIPEEVRTVREKELFESIQKSFSKKDWQKALASCEEILRINPQNATGFFVKGYLCQEHLEEYEQAEKAYRRAIELDAADTYTWHALGSLYHNQLEEYNKAEEAYRKAIELDRTDAASWYGLANLYQAHFGRYEEAEEAYRRSIEFDITNAAAWYALGDLYRDHLVRYEDAEAAYHKVIELDVINAAPWNNLGNLYQDHLGRYQKAEEAYCRAIELDETNTAPWNNRGNLYQNHLGRYEEAEGLYRRAIELDAANAAPWYGLGYLYRDHLGRYREAEEAFRQVAKLDTTDATPWNNLGYLYQDQLNRYEEAEQAYIRAIELDATDAYPWYKLGDLYQDQLNRYEEAERAYIRAIELDATDAYPWYKLGDLYQDQLNRYEEAEQAYVRAIELDATDADSWNDLGNLYQDHLKQYDKAEEAYRQAIKVDATSIAAKFNLIFLYRDKLNRLVEAKMLFEEMELPETFVDSYWLHASLFALYDKNLGMAEQHLIQALQSTHGNLPPSTQDDWWRFAGVALRLGYGQAILDVLQKTGYEVQLRPYAVAIRALLEKDSTAYLNSVAVEVREIAAELAERIKRFM